jgi:iron complex outermembrane receptor protein
LGHRALEYVGTGTDFMSNTMPYAYEVNFKASDKTYDALTDYFIENASFLKCDNITLGYSFKTYDDYLNGRVYLTASNVFTITKYDGLDPEVANGFDSNMYPRPMTFILGVNLNF